MIMQQEGHKICRLSCNISSRRPIYSSPSKGLNMSKGHVSDSSSDSDCLSSNEENPPKKLKLNEEVSSSSEEYESNTEEEDDEEAEEEEDEDDPVVKAIRNAKDKTLKDRPETWKLDSCPTSISFHPERQLLAVGTYDGDILTVKYSSTKNELVSSRKGDEEGEFQDRTVRVLHYSEDGSKLYAAFTDKGLVTYSTEGLKTERIIHEVTDASPNQVLEIDHNILAIGDDDGFVKLWDKRKASNAMSIQVSNNAINGMVSDENKQILACCTEDGYVASVKIRGGRVGVKSEQYDTEFTCLGTYRENSKLGVGDRHGRVYLFNWGEFGYHSDVYAGKVTEINAMVPITEKIGIMGCENGSIRAVNLYPHKDLGVVGIHDISCNMLDVSYDGSLIASGSAMGNEIMFWNVSYLEGFVLPPEITKKSGKTKDKMSKHNLPSSNHSNKADFFKGLTDD